MLKNLLVFRKTEGEMVIRYIKHIWGLAMWVLVLPFLALGMCYSRGDRFYMASLVVAYLPMKVGEDIRFRFYKSFLKRLGTNVRFKFGSYCQYRKIEIGDNSVIGLFSSVGLCDIGRDVFIGGYVNFLSGRHQHPIGDRIGGGSRQKISIGDKSWIGSNSVVMSDVGDGAIVGAGSVVVHPVSKSEVVVGNPARALQRRQEEKTAHD
jgi:acetyltransferase-like isoleucine patch superfamily enzyme